MSKIAKTLKTGILGGIAALAMSVSAFAGGDISAPPPKKNACSLSANVAMTTDYVFRGISQTNEDAAIQGGVDLTCGIFYAGVWGSNVDFGANDPTSAEFDFYAGIKKEYKGITFDLGVIVYTYDDADELVEIKIGASGEIYKGATLGVTGYFDTENEVNTVEVSFSKSFSDVGVFSPSFSAVVGFVDDETNFVGLGGDFTYWNAGVSLGFAKNFSLDLRYHDTDVDTTLTDERFVATLSASF